MFRFCRHAVFAACILALQALSAPRAPGYLTGKADFIITLDKAAFNHQAFDEIVAQYNLAAKYYCGRHGVAAIRLPQGLSSNAAADLLASDSRIIRVEPDHIISAALEFPNDPLFHQQWALYNPRQNRADIKAPEAWRIWRGKRRIVIAIIDTGIDYLHPDLAKNMWRNPHETPDNNRDDDGNGYVDDIYGWDFATGRGTPMDFHYHGTLMAGVVGAQADNGEGIAGIMHDVSMMAVKGLGDWGWGFTSDLIAGIYYAVDNGANVINASWGGGSYTQALYDAISYAGQHNVLFVAAAGNWHFDNDRYPFYPASYDCENIISVAASDRFDSLAAFSHYGATTVDLAAPGSRIISTTLAGGYHTTSGTSMASPHVAACAGLLMSYVPNLEFREYKSMILQSAYTLPHLKGLCVSGGRLDVQGALKSGQNKRNDTRFAVYYLSRKLKK